jgi:hypothetical protein
LLFDNPDHCGFVRESLVTASLAANVSFIGLDHAGERRRAVLLHHQADLLRHAPRGLIGHAEVPFQFFSRDTVLANTEEVNGVEPLHECCLRLMEDSIGERAELVATVVAGIALAPPDAVVARSNDPALGAGGEVTVRKVKHVIKTGIVVWKIQMERVDGISVYLHTTSVVDLFLDVKG